MPSTSVQKLDTGRSAEFADSAGGGGNGLALTFAEVNFTGGIQGVSSGTYIDVTGATITFSLPVAGTVQFFASATALSNPFTQGNYIGLGINVNGTDYPGGGTGGQAFNAAGGGILVTSGFTSGDSITLARALSLPAGSYTVKLRVLGSGYLESSTDFPTKLTAVYPTLTGPIAAASPITSQEAENTTGTTTAISTSPTLIPGTSMSVVLAGTGTVVFHGFGTATNSNGSFSASDIQIGVRVDGTDYWGGETLFYTGIASPHDFFSSVHKALPLGVGAHAVQLVVRSSLATPAVLLNSVDQPTRLTAIYTVPEALTPAAAASITKQEAENSTGTQTIVSPSAYVDVPSTLMSIALPSTQEVLLLAQGTVLQSTSPDNNGFNGQLSLSVDGTVYPLPASSWDSIYNRYEAPLGGSRSFTLGPGVHTVKLVFRAPDPTVSRTGVLANSVAFPTRLTAIYTSPQVITPTSEVVAESDSPSDSTSSASFVATGATVTFSLAASSLVQARAFTTVYGYLTADGVPNARIAINIDGTNYTEQDIANYAASTGPGYSAGCIFKDIVLAPGSHTITLMFSRSPFSPFPANAAVLQNTHLSVVYHA